MAKRRMLSATLGESRKYAALQTDIARVVYPLILANTDKGGRLEADPFYITRKICTRLPYTVDQVEEALRDMNRVGLIVLYQAGDIPALQVVGFREFNNPHWKEEESRLAPPDGFDVDGNIVGDGDDGNGQGRSNVDAKVGSSMGSSEGEGSLYSSPTKTQSPTRTPADEIDSSEDRMARAFATGQPQAAPKHRVRAELRRLAGPDFVQRHERFMDAWSRWSDDDLRALWDASDPAKWPGETHKKRAWLLKDLLDEERKPPRPRVDDDIGRSFADILAEAQRDLGVN